ncbi:MAG: bifunctional DNA primase/polymerase [Mycobacterium sp.]
MSTNPRPSISDHVDLLAAALEYANHHWAVFPLRGKVPAIPKRVGGRGVLDATTDTAVITAWWVRYPGANIGLRVPVNMIVIDIDPRSGGLQSLAALEAKYGQLPETLTTISGRGDGGKHLFYRRPRGTLSAARLGAGIDLKTHAGYVVGAPSIHHLTGKPYTRIDRPVAAPPAWLITLLLPEPPKVVTRPWRVHRRFNGPSIADQYCAATRWPEILEPHGWTSPSADSDAIGAVWLHPTHTSPCSATIGRHGCLYVWSPNTPFEQSATGDPRGYTKFKAYAQLNYGGDMSAAAKSLRKG